MNSVKIHRNVIKVNGVELFFMDTQTQGEAILCLHGRWGRAETWVDFIQHYGAQYRVIAPDQRGHGLSGKPVSKYTSAEMAADIIGLMDHLKIDKVILVGHSMGGSIAGYFAATYPDRLRAVAILDKTAGGPEKPNLTPLDELPPIDPITKDWPLPFSSLKEAQDFIKRDMETELSYQYFMNSLREEIDGVHMLFSAQAMAANMAYYQDWFDLLPKVKCPVMLARASSHEAVNDEDFSRMQALVSDCMAFEMSEPDHNVHLANKQEFYEFFDRFLDKVEGP
jgi:pimeloyl-ACP methyl ester carboxylesterase